MHILKDKSLKTLFIFMSTKPQDHLLLILSYHSAYVDII